MNKGYKNTAFLLLAIAFFGIGCGVDSNTGYVQTISSSPPSVPTTRVTEGKLAITSGANIALSSDGNLYKAVHGLGSSMDVDYQVASNGVYANNPGIVPLANTRMRTR
jgi:hypothetical protein